MSMKDKIEQWFNPNGLTPVTLGACNLSAILNGYTGNICPVAAEFFGTCILAEADDVPSSIVFHSAHVIGNVNINFPCDRLIPHGFVTFATLADGDVFAMDVADGMVYQISHDLYDSECGISQGWNYDCSAFLPDLPITRDNIIKTAKRRFGSIDKYLEHLLKEP